MREGVLRRNHVSVAGPTRPREHPQTIVFGHGFGGDQEMWHDVSRNLERDFRTVRFDYVGCGKSDPKAYDPRRYASLDGYARDLHEVLDALELSQVLYVGHSISSMLGMLVAIQEPARFARLVMVGASPRFLDDPPDYYGGFSRDDIAALMDLMDRNMLGWADFLAPVAMKNPDRPELAREFAARLSVGDPSIMRRFADAVFYADLRAELPRLSVPTLILQCADDSIAPRRVGEYLHEHIRGSSLRFMQASGHCPHVSHPDETTALLRDYFAS
ncbi:MAG TPA: alpha/beta hydrolase [Polyangiales bacterium]